MNTNPLREIDLEEDNLHATNPSCFHRQTPVFGADHDLQGSIGKVTV